jgi:hypothetical protein
MRSTVAATVAAVALAGAGLAGCGGGSSDSAPSTTQAGTAVTVIPDSASPTSSTSSAPSAPQGFRAAVIQVTRPDGSVASYCVWLATTEPERERGLMEVRTLGGADGMLFRFGADQSGSFWMKDTVLPLSIAFFRADGGYVSSTDMEPCPTDGATCPTYVASAAYADALEVPKGGLDALGIAEGARLTVTKAACQPGG